MSNVTVEEIGAFTAEVFGLPEAALLHPSVRVRAGAQGPDAVPAGIALHVAAYVARRHTAVSYPAIAKALVCRDHATLVKGVAGIDANLPRWPALAALVERIEAQVDALHETRATEEASVNHLPASTERQAHDHAH